jgi:arginase
MSFLGVPLYTMAKYRGMGAAVKALRNLGIAEALQKSTFSFNDLGDVPLPDLSTDSGPSNMKNFSYFLNSTSTIMDRASQVPREDFVFCLGGECGLALGTLTAFRSSFGGTPGLLWLDAHGDFNTPETTESGFVGGMPLAFTCGRGPKFPPNIERSRPLVKEENVVHLGSRDLDSVEARALESSPIRLYSAASLHKEGLIPTLDRETEYFTDNTDWIICHLDVDVIDPSIMPAVSFPTKDGLSTSEVSTVVKTLLKTGKLKVFNLTAYEPTLDTSYLAGKTLVSLVSEIFTAK